MVIQPLMVELGYQSKTRWQHISETYAELGMLPKGFDPSPIIYSPKPPHDYRLLIYISLLSTAVIGGLIWLTLTFRRLNSRLVAQIEEKQQIEEELRKSQELFSLLMKHTPVYTFIKEIEGEQCRVVLLSDNFFDMVGRPAAELRGRTMDELFPEGMARKMTLDDLDVIRSGKAVEVEEELGGRSYTTIKFPIKREGASPLIAGFTIDITARKQSEALLHESNERFRLAFENSNAGMCLVDLKGNLLKVNRQMSELLGYSTAELEQMTVNDITEPNYRQLSTTTISQFTHGSGDHFEFEKKYLHKDGRIITGLVSSSLVRDAAGEPCYFIAHVVDVTKQKEAEENRLELERQLLHAQKLESLGILAGGIAHDFNNLLTAIIGNAELALMKLSPDSPVVSSVQQIEKAAERATDLARQMLAYSGKGRFIIEKLDLNHLLKDMLHILEVSISKKNELHLDLPPNLPHVEADATQLRQIIMNLVINASEAIGDNQGIITISTGCQMCDRAYLDNFWLHENLAEGPYLCMEVTDTGCGMDGETLSRIFDPFFTTKFTGRGLGMSAVMGIVRGHKGAIKVESEPEKGTIFKVLLPACDSTVALPVREKQYDDWCGKGTVLLVDDEEQVREIGTIMLEQLGLNVITAGDGREALEKFTSNDNIAVIILDLTMPKMDGEQCFRELRKLGSNVKIIMSSGYSEQEIISRFNESGLGFIQKPYRISDLQAALKELL
ncbi:MAG: PAS domain S-box protein [Geobacter sp.]|nr:PAS domain S-box protein [Geobacter sp.]